MALAKILGICCYLFIILATALIEDRALLIVRKLFLKLCLLMKKPGLVVVFVVILLIALWRLHVRTLNYEKLEKNGKIAVVYGVYEKDIDNTNYYFKTEKGEKIALTSHINSKKGFDDYSEGSKVYYDPDNPENYEETPYHEQYLPAFLIAGILSIFIHQLLGGVINRLTPAVSKKFNRKYSVEGLKNNGILKFETGHVFFNFLLPNVIFGFGTLVVLMPFVKILNITSPTIIYALLIFLEILFIYFQLKKIIGISLYADRMEIQKGYFNPQTQTILLEGIIEFSHARRENVFKITLQDEKKVKLDYSFTTAKAKRLVEIVSDLKGKTK